MQTLIKLNNSSCQRIVLNEERVNVRDYNTFRRVAAIQVTSENILLYV